MRLECSLEVVRLVTTVDHLLGFFLENVRAAIVRLGRRRLDSSRIILLLGDALEESLHVIVLVSVVHQRDFRLWRNYVLLGSLLHRCGNLKLGGSC